MRTQARASSIASEVGSGFYLAPHIGKAIRASAGVLALLGNDDFRAVVVRDVGASALKVYSLPRVRPAVLNITEVFRFFRTSRALSSAKTQSLTLEPNCYASTGKASPVAPGSVRVAASITGLPSAPMTSTVSTSNVAVQATSLPQELNSPKPRKIFSGTQQASEPDCSAVFAVIRARHVTAFRFQDKLRPTKREVLLWTREMKLMASIL